MSLSRAELNRMSDATTALLEGVINDTIDIPNNSIVFLSYKDLFEVLTKKRLELIDAIRDLAPNSAQALARAVHRKKQAVNRDLRYLERQEIIKLERRGRTVVPRLEKEIILLPLVMGKGKKGKAAQAKLVKEEGARESVADKLT